MATVTRLPTAAKRKPSNDRYAAQARAARTLRQNAPWPGEHIYPAQRDRHRDADAPAGLEQSPLLFAMLCLLTAFPADRLDALVAAADMLLDRDPTSPDAQSGRALIGEAVNRRRAMAVLAGEGC